MKKAAFVLTFTLCIDISGQALALNAGAEPAHGTRKSTDPRHERISDLPKVAAAVPGRPGADGVGKVAPDSMSRSGRGGRTNPLRIAQVVGTEGGWGVDYKAKALAVLAERADLVTVSRSSGTHEEHAKTACLNLFSNTFGRDGDVLVTRFTSMDGKPYYLKFSGFDFTSGPPARLGEADRLNGWAFAQQIFLRAKAYVLSTLPKGQDRPWEGPWGGMGLAKVVACTYGVKNEEASIEVELIRGPVNGPMVPGVDAWSRP